MRSTRGMLWIGCVLGALGGSGCLALDWENIEEASEEGPVAACGPGWKVTGTVQAGETRIDYSGGQATVTAVHKLDADPVEDGCLGRLELNVTGARGQCPLKLVFMGRNGAWGGLVEARLLADSGCPGFLDAVEGLYATANGFAPWELERPVWKVPEHGVPSLCQGEVTLGFAERPVRLYRSGGAAAELTLRLEHLSLRGGLASRGDAGAKCFEVSTCGPGWHDGGDGWCVETGRCSPGFTRLPTGDCAR